MGKTILIVGLSMLFKKMGQHRALFNLFSIFSMLFVTEKLKKEEIGR